ncbi:toll/interleukin-1 receptor domain-containing protein [Nakamurella sp.]|uniref:toll/interleukin-1 receptor domain-containing protein n=1 Tax=Nakamurella sp. TaxID=1869182 RepID=UPI00378314B4
MKIFVSYSRDDKPAADRISALLAEIDHQPWADRHLSGGQLWWDVIIRAIQESDVMIVILSPASLASQACRFERDYANRLGKSILPIMIAPISVSALPADLSMVQLVDATTADIGSETAALVRALNRLPPVRPLPRPLPSPPPIPLSYLSNLSDQIDLGRQLSYEEQIAIVNQLQNAARSEDLDERRGGVALLSRLRSRRDIYADTAQHIERIQFAAGPAAFPAAMNDNRVGSNGSAMAAGPGAGQNLVRPATGTTTTVKVFAWIGGIVVALIVFGAIAGGMSGGAAGGTDVCQDQFGNYYTC